MTEVEAHMVAYSLFATNHQYGRLLTGSTNFDHDGG